jgi:GT2 family glycosyltransferase
MPRISVLIITYNSASTIQECLQSLQNQSFRDFEVILLDNASTDTTKEAVESVRPILTYPLRVHYGSQNLGFTGGNNKAFQLAGGEYVALLNPDTEPVKEWIGTLVAAMDADAQVGICASKLIVHGTDRIDSAGDGYSRALRGFKRGEGQSLNKFTESEAVFGACAGAALYRRKMVDEIGFMDDDLFLIHEDTDLNLRAHLAGWKVMYVPSALVSHKVRTSIGQMSDTAVFYSLRNAEIVRLKGIPFSLFLKFLPEITLQLVAEFFYFALRHGKIRTYFRAKMSVLALLPRTLEQRRALLTSRKVSNRDLGAAMTSVYQADFVKEKLRKIFFG